MGQSVPETLAPITQQVADVAVDYTPAKMTFGASRTAFSGPSSEVELVHLSRAIRVRQFQTKLEDATVFDGAESQGKAKQVLRDQRFDYAPVQLEGQLLGYIAEADLKADSAEPISSRLRPVTPQMIVSGDALFHDLLRWLHCGFLFVLEGNRLTGFLTPSDANRQEARSYFYLLVAEVEVGLAHLIRDHFRPVEQALKHLPPGRQEKIEEKMRRDRSDNLDADPVSYFEFCDLTTVVRKTDDIRLGFSCKQWEKCTSSLVGLRNWVMHPVSCRTPKYLIEQLVDFDERLTDLLGRIHSRLGIQRKGMLT